MEKPQEKKKLTFKDKYALENLPKEIGKLEKEIAELSAKLGNPTFYQQDPKEFNKAAEKLERKKREKDEKEFQLMELEDLVAE